ncbi:hypothetical protein GCM10010271_39640 [Streptomyces kurssanovii]|nr:hypothetical protein GCM10010271_39640 [Streptomyces kurssanovii]
MGGQAEHQDPVRLLEGLGVLAPVEGDQPERGAAHRQRRHDHGTGAGRADRPGQAGVGPQPGRVPVEGDEPRLEVGEHPAVRREIGQTPHVAHGPRRHRGLVAAAEGGAPERHVPLRRTGEGDGAAQHVVQHVHHGDVRVRRYDSPGERLRRRRHVQRPAHGLPHRGEGGLAPAGLLTLGDICHAGQHPPK